jgi:hypothetical protein
VTQTIQTLVPVLLEVAAQAVHLDVIGPVQPSNAVTALDDQFGLAQHPRCWDMAERVTSLKRSAISVAGVRRTRRA